MLTKMERTRILSHKFAELFNQPEIALVPKETREGLEEWLKTSVETPEPVNIRGYGILLFIWHPHHG